MKKLNKQIILLFITLIFLYLICINLDINKLIEYMMQFKIIYIIPLIISLIVSLSFRGMVFKQLLKDTAELPLLESAHLCITSSALNILLPARAGDLFRAFFTGKKYNTDKIKIFGTVMLERILDVLVIFSFLLIGIFIYKRNHIAMRLCSFAGMAMIIGIAIIIYAQNSNKTEKILKFINEKMQKNNVPPSQSLPLEGGGQGGGEKHTSKLIAKVTIKKIISFINNVCNSFFKGFEIIKSPRIITGAVCASFMVWVFECLNFYIVMLGFNCNIHWSVTLFIIGFIALACMIPSASIYIGPYQMAVITAFGLYNVDKEAALAISLVEQAVVIITTSVIALLFFIKHNISYKQIS